MKKTWLLAIVSLLVGLFFIPPMHITPVSAAVDSGDKYDILMSLGFFDRDSVYSDNTAVTRIEMINAIIHSLPEEKVLPFNGSDTGFSDVASDDPIAQVAYNAKMYGLLKDETELRPYDIATAEDASFILLNLLGYGEIVGTDYLLAASSLGLTKSMPAGNDFTMGQLVVMLYNALNTDVLQWHYSSNGTWFDCINGKTYMTEILKAGKGKGLVTATELTALGGYDIAGKGYLRVGNELYSAADDIPQANHLGETVDYYYRFDEDGNQKMVYLKTSNPGNILEIRADQVQSFQSMTYTYTYGSTLEKTRKATILKSADIIYNGKLITSDIDIYQPKDGIIKLIDNNSDGQYEIAIITEYDVMVVGGIDKVNGTISNLNDPGKEPYQVNLYAENAKYAVYDADGTVKKFSDIFKYDVIFVSQSYDKELCTITVSDKKIRGTITLYSDERIEIDGVSYKAADCFFESTNVEVGLYGIFHLDPLGRLGYFERQIPSDLKAGYLIGAEKDDEHRNTLAIRVFTESGEVATICSAKRFYYTYGNDAMPTKTRVDNIDSFLALLAANKKSELGGGMLILYKLNSEGKLTEMEIPADFATDIERAEFLDNQSVFRQTTKKVSKTLHKDGLFNLEMRLGSETKVFSIPSDIDKTDKFAVYTGFTNCFAWNTQYTVAGFTKRSNSQYADYILAFLSGGDGQVNENRVFLVEEVNEAINSDGEPVKVIAGKWGSESKEFYLNEELSENDINSGDVLRLGLDEDNNVITMKQVLSMNRPSPGTIGNITDIYYSYYGYAYDLKGSTLRVTLKEPESVTETTDLINTFSDRMGIVYKYDSERKKFEPADYNSIITYRSDHNHYSRIFAWFYYADHKLMVIYD